MLTDQFMTSLFSPLCVCMEMTWVELGVRMGGSCGSGECDCSLFIPLLIDVYSVVFTVILMVPGNVVLLCLQCSCMKDM